MKGAQLSDLGLLIDDLRTALEAVGCHCHLLAGVRVDLISNDQEGLLLIVGIPLQVLVPVKE